ncbi:MAG: hypothetical protein AVDCRST_MAG26-3258 [uncultured Chloroflexia bacterium]|uniref:Uncharacterized protein n=1 Tax=uncultured Chloroflexia bacterium TaxID=1672391 RepID=A0A6J4JHJ5_9CHLR|nr:MAG: hypothetical protein AVDCRST_MAG26-3258 [uncultured Chloroflexia bacterium]
MGNREFMRPVYEHDQRRFTREFQDLMGEPGWEAKAFVGHLLKLWYDLFEHMLDYSSGEATATLDQPGEFDRNGLDEPQDVVEYWAASWSVYPNAHSPAHEAGTGLDLDAAWYRDILRAKLVSLRLPVRLLIAYKEQVLARIQAWESDLGGSSAGMLARIRRETGTCDED